VLLNIDAGTVIKFNGAFSVLAVSGNLSADGTSSPIYFTSYKDDICSTGTSTGCDSNNDGSATTPSAGNWGNITVNSGGIATLNNTIVRYGGNVNFADIYNDGGSLTIFNSIIASSSNSGVNSNLGTTTVVNSTSTSNVNYGIFADGGTLEMGSNVFAHNGISAAYAAFSSFPVLILSNSGANKAYDNGKNGMIVDGFIYGNQSWGKDDMAYIVGDPGSTDTLWITSGKTLEIDPGLIFKFSPNANMQVDGTLKTSTSSDQTATAVFTSIKDDLSGIVYDTNNDGSSTVAAPGDWGYIRANTGSTITLSRSLVRYGGNNGIASTTGMFFNAGGTLILDASSTVASSTTNGIFSSSGTTYITDSDLAFNRNTGIYINGGTVSATSSYIHGNLNYGVYNSLTPTTTATNNYWGDDDGPSTTTPKTAGDLIFGKVDYLPWKTLNMIHFLFPNGNAVDATDPNACEIRYEDMSGYSEVAPAISTWDLGRIDFSSTTISHTLEFVKQNNSDVVWKGFTDAVATPLVIKLNSYYLDDDSSTLKQNTITHELGHALGLNHSYTGNIMYAYQTMQTALGSQDINDYDYMWSQASSTCNYH
jgi:hypothetical protein